VNETTRTSYAATLDRFTSHVGSAPGVQLRSLAPLTTLLVRTRNTEYRIMVSHGDANTVLVQGGQFFPTPTVACLEGASLGGSFLKVGWIGVGLSMEIRAGEQRIVTTPVRGIESEAAASASVH
jgi:hypothetical protein